MGRKCANRGNLLTYIIGNLLIHIICIYSTRLTSKRKLDTTGFEVEETFEILQHESGPNRILWRQEYVEEHQSKRQRQSPEEFANMMANGRPMQVHAVPPEERAFDANGKQLPWGLEWADDHPNARGQKRHPVESGPFGKSTRRTGSSRLGSSRVTRTATPAKKDSLDVDGFMRGLQEDKRRAELYGEGTQTVVSSSALQQDNKAHTASKEPVQVVLYGFSPATQWAAISFYERASGGMICEDYDRHPPPEARRIPTTFSSPGLGPRRALTTAERKLSMAYKGGNSWIKVTFDSADAADRAWQSSPHLIQGHWVYAELYTGGIIPNNDQPIPLSSSDRLGDMTTSARPTHVPTHKNTQSLGPAFSRNTAPQQSQTNATLPRSFTSNLTPQQSRSQRPETDSESPSTASSATATNATNGQPNSTLRQRGSAMTGGEDIWSNGTATPQQQPNIQYMTHFPDIPRTILRPASEAFLPLPTRSERIQQFLESRGWMPGDIIGHAVPRTETGEFDYANASFYWRFFHWFDTTFGTDICGLKDD